MGSNRHCITSKCNSITVNITSLGKSNRMNIGFVNVIRDLCRRHNRRKTKEREEKMLHMDEREIKI